MFSLFWRTGLRTLVLADIATNKRVFVTGGAQGIGEGIVRALADDGFNVTFTYNSSSDQADSLVEELRGQYPNLDLSSYQIDLGNRDEVDVLAEQISSDETLYGLVCNAGNSYDALAALVDQDRGEALFQLNFWAMTRLSAAASRPMIRAKEGRIVGIGSVTAQFGVTGNSIYAASKGAMLSYIKTLAIELARKNVTANYIAPGFVDTNLLAAYADHRKDVEKQIPLRRYAQPAEIGGLVSYLLSPLAGYITGSVIPIDGGLNANLSVRR